MDDIYIAENLTNSKLHNLDNISVPDENNKLIINEPNKNKTIKIPDFYCHANLEIKSHERDTRNKHIENDEENGMMTIEGFASTKDLDRDNDITLPESFSKTLKDFMQNPILLYMHNMTEPIGKVIEASIHKDKGLFIKAKVSKTEWDIQEKIREKILKAFSFGFKILDSEFIDRIINGKKITIKIIKTVELLEVSIVSIPMNKRALFNLVKSMKSGTDLVCKNCNHECNDKDIKSKIDDTPNNKLAEQEIIKLADSLNNLKAGCIDVLSTKNRTIIKNAKIVLDKVLENDKPIIDDKVKNNNKKQIVKKNIEVNKKIVDNQNNNIKRQFQMDILNTLMQNNKNLHKIVSKIKTIESNL